MLETPPIPTPPATLDDVAALLRTIADRMGNEPAEAMTFAEAAKFLNVSLRKIHQLNEAGFLPGPVMLGDGNCPRLIRAELRAWLLSGAPARSRWNSMRQIVLRRAG